MFIDSTICLRLTLKWPSEEVRVYANFAGFLHLINEKLCLSTVFTCICLVVSNVTVFFAIFYVRGWGIFLDLCFHLCLWVSFLLLHLKFLNYSLFLQYLWYSYCFLLSSNIYHFIIFWPYITYKQYVLEGWTWQVSFTHWTWNQHPQGEPSFSVSCVFLQSHSIQKEAYT